MPRFQNKPSLADLARRRGQSIFDLLKDWGISENLPDDEFDVVLQKRCLKEGVKYVKVERVPKRALVTVGDPPKQESAFMTGKKIRKSKVTLDESLASDEHIGVDPRPSFGSKDST